MSLSMNPLSGVPRRDFLLTAATLIGGPFTAGLPLELHAEEPPSWLRDAASYKLPLWFDSHRAHLHTRLGFSNERHISKSIGKALRSIGVRVFCRHVKSGDGGPLWPTAIGNPDPLAVNRNFVAEMIADAHQADCRMIGYYWETSEKSVEEEHPDWLCRDPKGEPCAGVRGNFLCQNSPYRDFVEKRLLELVDMGIDGLYFDWLHMPVGGCWCNFCREKFRIETNLAFPTTSRLREPNLPALIDFNNRTIEDAFRQWREAVHRQNPECVMCVSSGSYANLQPTHMSTRLFHLMDSNKTEFARPYTDGLFFERNPDLRKPEKDVMLAMGWSLCRDGSDGRPAHVWLPGMQDEIECQFGAAGIVTHGCIANIDMIETTIPDLKQKKAFDLCEQVSPAFTKVRPLRWAAIHFSELARRSYAIGGNGKREMWIQSTARSFGAYRAMFGERLPLTLITDSQLELGWTDEIKLLFLPNPELLSEKMRNRILDFQKKGGLVIKHLDGWKWHTEEGISAATAELRNAISEIVVKAPVRVLGGPERLHYSSFISDDGRRLVVPVCNDFSWIDPDSKGDSRTTRKPEYVQPIENGTVIINRLETPKTIYEAVTGLPLEAKTTKRGLEVALPAFDILSIVVAEY